MKGVGEPDSSKVFTPLQQPSVEARIDWSEAQSAYEQAITHPMDYHAEVGVLFPDGQTQTRQLGKKELHGYGAHRVGSVTKTFTTFLALKLAQTTHLLPNGLSTRCHEILPDEVFEQVFEDPDAARAMTLEQLLSHTAGLELEDHNGKYETPPSSLHERFLQEKQKFKHVSKPGEGLGTYSNAGLAVAGWVLEYAYNIGKPSYLPFGQIMEQEIFKGVFDLKETSIEPGPSGDIIDSPAGGMRSSVSDLLTVARILQEGPERLGTHFGVGWQSKMQKPRDLLQQFGLGCEANVPSLQHAGLNREKFGNESRDVSALVVFPLKPRDRGVVAMCDSSALGPKPPEQHFLHTLKRAAGLGEEPGKKPQYDMTFDCPSSEQTYLFHGSAYLTTNVDPFSKDPPSEIICSRNGMKHVLTRDPKLDQAEIRGYRDTNGDPWSVIMRTDGRRAIYSRYCLVSERLEVGNLAASQPSKKALEAITGIYRDVSAPREHPIYIFFEKEGHLYMREEDSKESYPCLFIPDKAGSQEGKWVVSDPTGRSIQFRFPRNPEEEPLQITTILGDLPQLPEHSQRLPKGGQLPIK